MIIKIENYPNEAELVDGIINEIQEQDIPLRLTATKILNKDQLVYEVKA